MNLSSILVAERKKKGETQQKVADALYISRQSLSNWENGKNFPDIP
ncbi:MAG: helix-turn-helix domain-containing protein, partial [Lactococcus sp.]|nr:helix-turn-helix domain-containing protein [Lactococcus sp.]